MRSRRGVSVVVPHYGPPEQTTALVTSLLAQTHADLEVIVSDDCSPQAFPQAFPQPSAQAAGAHDRVQIVRRERNGGFGAAVNSGVAVATRELVLILNSDVEVTPDFVERLVDEAEPWQPAVCGPLLLDGRGGHEITGRHFPTTVSQAVEWTTPLARFRDHRVLHEAIGNDTRCVPGATVAVDWLVGAALLLPRTTFREVGGFDEGYFMNCEEVDLQRRLRDLGVPSVFLGAVAAVHEGGGSSDPARRREWTVASRRRYAARWGSPRRLTAALVAATAVNAVSNTLRQLAGRDVDARAVAREELRLAAGELR